MVFDPYPLYICSLSLQCSDMIKIFVLVLLRRVTIRLSPTWEYCTISNYGEEQH